LEAVCRAAPAALHFKSHRISICRLARFRDIQQTPSEISQRPSPFTRAARIRRILPIRGLETSAASLASDCSLDHRTGRLALIPAFRYFYAAFAHGIWPLNSCSAGTSRQRHRTPLSNCALSDRRTVSRDAGLKHRNPHFDSARIVPFCSTHPGCGSRRAFALRRARRRSTRRRHVRHADFGRHDVRQKER